MHRSSEANSLHEIVLDTIQDGIWATDAGDRIILFNRAMERLSALAAEAALGLNALQDALPWTTADFLPGYLHARTQLQPVSYEAELLSPGGGLTIQSVCLTPRVEDGRFAGMVCTARDVTECRRSEAALRETQAILYAAMEQSQAGIAIAEAPSGRLLYVNKAGLLIRGADAGNVVEGIDLDQYVRRWQMMDLDGTPLATDAVPLVRAIQRGEESSREFIIRRSEHDDRTVAAQAAPIFDAQGTVKAAVVVFQDITARRQAEEAQREAQQLLKIILESISVRVFWKDKNLMYLGCNALFAQDAGFNDPKDIVGKDDYALAWAEQAEFFRRDDREVIESGHPKLLIEEQLMRSDGKLITLLTGKVPLLDERGEIRGVLGTYMDITARKEAEEAHARSHALLENLAGLVPGVIYQYRLFPDGRSCFPYASRGICEIYEVTPEAVQQDASPVFNRLHSDDLARVSRDILESARNLTPFHCEFRVVLPSQGLRWRWCQALPERTQDGGVLWHGIIMDITDRKQAEVEQEQLRSQLTQAQKLESIGRLAGGVAHDFNNMLNVILGHAELALEDLALESPMRSDLGEIRKAAVRSADLTRQLLAFARKQTISPRPLELNETVASMLRMLGRLIGENIKLAWMPANATTRVCIDPAQIDQMLANLIVNARDAIGHENGTITIETGRATFDEAYCVDNPGYSPGNYIMLAVSDNGCGMDQAVLANIFEPFFTTKAVGEGTGLGLSTVYGIVMQNHGFINVYSEPGLGTTFRIYLPEKQAEMPVASQAPAAPLARGEEVILLVEDEPAILAMTRTMLVRLGYTVLAAATPGDAVLRAREHQGVIHLLISDVVMPEMNGKDLADTLMAIHPELKHLFMSGYTADIIGEQGVLQEAVNFIQKPFSRQALAAKVREVLGGAPPSR